MSRAEARLNELGLDLPGLTAPLASYVPAVMAGNMVYTSGQLPIVAGELHGVGKVGEGDGCISEEHASALARLCALNALAAIKSVVGDLDRVTQVVKVVGFVACDPDFSRQPSVVNGASELLAFVFEDRGQHARSAVGVAALPLDSPVEVELIVTVD